MPQEQADTPRLDKLSAIAIDHMVTKLWEGWSRSSLEERAIEDRELNEAYPNGFGQREVTNALIVISGYDIPIDDLQADDYSSFLDTHTLSRIRITGDQKKILVMHATRLLRLKAKYPALYYQMMNASYSTDYPS